MQTKFSLVIILLIPWGLCKWDYKRGYMCSNPSLYSRPQKGRVWLFVWSTGLTRSWCRSSASCCSGGGHSGTTKPSSRGGGSTSSRGTSGGWDSTCCTGEWGSVPLVLLVFPWFIMVGLFASSLWCLIFVLCW